MFFTVWVPRWEAKRAKSEKVRAIIAVARAAAERARIIRGAVDRSASQEDLGLEVYLVYDHTIITGLVRALQAVPAHELGSSRGVSAYLSLTDQVVLLGAGVERFIAGPNKHSELSLTLQSYGEGQSRERRELYQNGRRVLAKKVGIHHDRIENDYRELVGAVGGADAADVQ
jgi:hypothetical protein